MVAELGLQEHLKRVNVSVLNGQIETTPVVCGTESLDGKSRLTFIAFTVERVTGDMKTMDWLNTYARDWPHLQHLGFPKL